MTYASEKNITKMLEKSEETILDFSCESLYDISANLFSTFLLLCYIETGNGNMGMNYNVFHIFSEYDYNACIEKYLQVEILLLFHMSVCPWNV